MSSRPESDISIKRLELWAERLVRIRTEVEQCRCTLADHGVIIRRLPPRVAPRDGARTVRFKERLIALHRERDALIEEISRSGAELIDQRTLEIVLPGGPEPGTYLSWQPGEPGIGWWRESNDPATPRRELVGEDREGCEKRSITRH